MANDGKSSPFNGSGGKGSGGAWTYQQGSASRPVPGGAPRDPGMVPPGGPLPFSAANPSDMRGGPVMKPGLPIKIGGGSK